MSNLNIESRIYELTGLTPILGSAPASKAIRTTWVGSKAPTDELRAEEAESPIDIDEKGLTIFNRDKQDQLCLMGYQIKGFFKDSCGMLSRVSGKDASGKKKKLYKSAEMSAYKKIIDGGIFVSPRQIPISINTDVGICQRPLRAQTMQGERVALAMSEEIPAGASIEFEIGLLSDEYEDAVIEWLDYGILRGLGQWRNSGKGRFVYEILDAPSKQNEPVKETKSKTMTVRWVD